MYDASANAVAVNPIAPSLALGSMVAWRFGPHWEGRQRGWEASYERRS